ncbi:MAG: flagellar motor switch protein FliM [Rhodospirillaceae bacterium]
MVAPGEEPEREVSQEDEEAMMAEWEAMMGDDGDGDGDGEDGGGGDGVDDAAAASEWEAMLADGDGGGDDVDMGMGEEGGEGGEGGSTRVLNQEEIDSLLGFNESEEESADKSGIQAILSTALVSYERLPMLEVVFDRLVRMMSTSLRNFTSDNVEVSLDNIQSYRFGDYLNSIPLPAMLSVFKAEEWDNYGLLTIDSSMIYSIVDVLLGGRRGTAAMRIEGRPYTTIERNLVERLVHVVLADLSAAFDPLSPVTFRFDRLETNPRFATISRPSNAAIVAKLRIDMEDRGGRLDMLIPYATLEPVRELLLQMFMGEKFGRDSIWETHLAEEMWFTEVEMEAILDEVQLPLNRILNLEVGSQIMFNASPDSTVELRCGDVPMFRGRMGRQGQNIAIRVDERTQKAKTS